MLRYLLDENLRGIIWQAIQQHNQAPAEYPLDAVRVGDNNAPPLGIQDPDLLEWLAACGRILVSDNRSTMPQHVKNHRLASGDHCPGLFLLRRSARLAEIVSFLVVAAWASDEDDWTNRIVYIP